MRPLGDAFLLRETYKDLLCRISFYLQILLYTLIPLQWPFLKHCYMHLFKDRIVFTLK